MFWNVGVACMVHCSGTGVNVLECGDVRVLGVYFPFVNVSREHIRLARRYCVPSVDCIA